MGSAHLAQLTGAKIVNGDFETFGHGDHRLNDGDTFTVGELTLKALHTPGHTPESMSYVLYGDAGASRPWAVFTGDTLFYGTSGRTDLPDADKSIDNAALLYDSVHDKLFDLPDSTLVLPAHGPGSVCGSGMADLPVSTLGEEKKYNDVFTLSRQDFANKKGGERPSRPPYFRLMEKGNLDGGMAPPQPANTISLLGPKDFSASSKDGLVIDTREPEGFAGGHIPESYSIWLGGLPVFGGWVTDRESHVHLVTERPADIATAKAHLSQIGVDHVDSALAGGVGAWRKSGLPVANCPTITPRTLAEQNYPVLDVREIDEFESGHIPGATHSFVGTLEDCIDELPFDKSKPVVVTCGVGHRAGVAVSMLLRAGFTDVRNLLGGMSAWPALDLPIEK